MIDWNNSRGFVITGTAINGSSKTFRITFADPVPEGLILYRLPGWTRVSYTIVDKHTIEVGFWLYSGSYTLSFVLAKAAPLPTISAIEPGASAKLSLRFPTTIGYRYAVQQTPDLNVSPWVEIKHSRDPGNPATLDALDGTGVIDCNGGVVAKGLKEEHLVLAKSGRWHINQLHYPQNA